MVVVVVEWRAARAFPRCAVSFKWMDASGNIYIYLYIYIYISRVALIGATPSSVPASIIVEFRRDGGEVFRDVC